jgi:hypothetical protein
MPIADIRSVKQEVLSISANLKEENEVHDPVPLLVWANKKLSQ